VGASGEENDGESDKGGGAGLGHIGQGDRRHSVGFEHGRSEVDAAVTVTSKV
jgi:hypothetical protein